MSAAPSATSCWYIVCVEQWNLFREVSILAELLVPIQGGVIRRGGRLTTAYGHDLDAPEWRGAEIGFMQSESDAELASEFAHQAHVVATDGGQLIQIMDRSVSKDVAVHRILTALQIAPAAAMVFGDDHNDTGLFALCGFPVAMANAVPELKQMSWFVTASNNDDGVAMAINRFVLTQDQLDSDHLFRYRPT